MSRTTRDYGAPVAAFLAENRRLLVLLVLFLCGVAGGCLVFLAAHDMLTGDLALILRVRPVEKGLAGGAILYTDSSHVKAKANKHKKTTVVVERTPKAYSEELDEAIERDRRKLGRKPFGRKDDDPPPTREVSKSDPESGRL